jgi:hypothetical protein
MMDAPEVRLTEFDRRSREAAAARGAMSEAGGFFTRVGRSAANLLNAVPGYTGYRAKEDRRDADRRVRDHLVRVYSEQAGRVERVARDLAEQRRITDVGPVDEFAQAIRHLIDRINTATYGYGGLFSDRDIDERALDQLRLFDEGMLTGVEQLEQPIRRLEAAHKENTALAGIAREGRDIVRAINDRFDKRGEIIETGQPLPEQSVRAVLEMAAPEGRTPPAYWLDDGDALTVFGDDVLVDARLDVAAAERSFRMFRLSGVPQEEWLLVMGQSGTPYGRLRPLPATAPAVGSDSITINGTPYRLGTLIAGQGELIGPGGVSGYRPVKAYRLTSTTDESQIGILLDWGNEQQAFVGTTVHPQDVEIYGQPGALAPE